MRRLGLEELGLSFYERNEEIDDGMVNSKFLSFRYVNAGEVDPTPNKCTWGGGKVLFGFSEEGRLIGSGVNSSAYRGGPKTAT